MGSKTGAIKAAASKSGLSVDEYLSNINAGLKRCTYCKKWKNLDSFSVDNSRNDGLKASCRGCDQTRTKLAYTGIPLELRKRPGLVPMPSRDGDKKQARSRINHLVTSGRIMNPNALCCTDCGHKGTDRRHEYDHYRGYGADNHFDVQPVCTKCHAAREKKRRTS